MIRVLLSEGPFGGLELHLAGTPPEYLMMLRHPTDPSYPSPLVVGAGFDDHWPGQERYNLDRIYDGGPVATAIYVHES